MSEIEQPKQKWDLSTTIVVLSSVCVPLIIAVIGAWYNISMKNSENRVRYVELAIDQLRTAPSPDSTALREWAVNLLDSQAPVKLSDAAKRQLMSTPLMINLSAASVQHQTGGATLEVK